MLKGFFCLNCLIEINVLKEQLPDTWEINQRMNLLLINNTSDTGMQKTLSIRGGRSIFQQWVHIHNVRMQWLEVCTKDIFLQYTVLNKDIPVDKKVLIKALEESAEGISLLLSRS